MCFSSKYKYRAWRVLLDNKKAKEAYNEKQTFFERLY